MQPNNLTIKFMMHCMDLTIVCIVLTIAGCGLDHKPHFDDKKFGQTDVELGIGKDDNGPKTGKIETPMVVPPPPPIATQPLPPPPVTPPVTPPGPQQPSKPDADDPMNQVLSHYQFAGYFNLNSAQRILRGSDPISATIPPRGSIDKLVSRFLAYIVKPDYVELLKMQIRQNGKEQNLVTQVVDTQGGDLLSQIKHEESQSGTQYIAWTLADSSNASIPCPRPFVCINRLVWVPKSGTTMTYCYRDHASQQWTSIPYSANSHFAPDSYLASIGQGLKSPPIEVVAKVGNVWCHDTNAVTKSVTLVTYNLRLGDLSDQKNNPKFLQRAFYQPLVADTEVILEYNLFNPTYRRPYLPKTGLFIDQLTRLNTRMRFFLNSKEHVFVKIERTVQSPFKMEGSQIPDFIRSAYGRIPAALLGQIFPKNSDQEGMQLVYSFEFCTHLSVIPNPFNHCTGLTEL